MNTGEYTPTSPRGRAVYFIWRNMPRLALLLMMALIVVLIFAIQRQGQSIAASKAAAISKEKPPVNAVTLTLQPGTISDRINLPGSLEPWTELGLLAKISGTVEELVVEEGDRVNKGDVIARIEEADYRIALDRAQADYDLAKADYERDKAIYQKGMIPTAEIESRRTRMQTAKADLEHARLQLSRCAITAPMTGVIQKMDAKVGLLLSVGDPIATILEVDRLKAVVGIPESDVSNVRGLSEVTLFIQALNRTITVKPHFLSPSPESIARSYRLELDVDNAQGDILPGMFVRADIIKRSITSAIRVPFYSVISRNDQQFVFVERDGVAYKKPVSLGIMEKWLVEVTSGLDSGDHLVVEGHRDIEDQQQVKVVKAATSLEELSL